MQTIAATIVRSPVQWSWVHRYLRCALPVCLLCFLFYRTSVSVVDLDLWHEMALARESIQQGSVPWTDDFAYSPTVETIVHHEWAMGLIALGVGTAFGSSGLIGLKLILIFGLAVLCWRIASQRCSSMIQLAIAAGLAIALADASFATVRAQMFSYLFAAMLIGGFELDRQGRRWWLVAFVCAFPAWVNIHGGALVGAALLGAHWFEQLVRRQPHWHLIGGGIALIPMAAINPWGFEYHCYLVHAMSMPRPAINEWLPLWYGGNEQTVFAYAVTAFIVVAYARQVGWHRMQGIVIVLATSLTAMKSIRFLPFFAIAVAVYLPSYLQYTRLGETLEQYWKRWSNQFSIAMVVLACAFSIFSASNEPFVAIVPGQPSSMARQQLYYPVGAVEYLRANRFVGNVLTSYNHGSYVSWKLHPQAKVFIDSRYEVAYPLDRIDEQTEFFLAQPNWRDVLERYPHDIVLIPTSEPIYLKMKSEPDWKQVYRDTAFAIFADKSTDLPTLALEQPAYAGCFP